MTKAQGVADRIDAIESAYEFMLAYAAQGRRGTEGGPSDEIRGYLDRLTAALDGLAEAVATEAAAAGGGTAAAIGRFGATLAADVGAAQAAVGLITAQSPISSQLVDNLNASIHVRTLLTDLFLIDSVLTKTVAS